MRFFFFTLLACSALSGLFGQGFTQFGSLSGTSGRMIVANIDTFANPDIINRRNGIFDRPDFLQVVLNPGLTPDDVVLARIEMPQDVGRGLAAGDLDGDGDTDLIANQDDEDHLYLFTNDGTGAFDTSRLAIGGVGQALVADMNGDSLPDIVGTSYLADQLTVSINDGAGGFTLRQVSTFDAFSFVAMDVKDFDNDGDQDILICYDGFANNNLVLYLNDGNLGFSPLFPRPRSVRNILQVRITDFNNDGLPDILVADRSEIFMVPQTADGLGTPQSLFTSGRDFNSFAFGDFDENGLQDLIIGHDGDVPEAIVLRANYGEDNTFQFDSVLIGRTRPTFNMIPADMDLDGDLDLVTTNTSVYYYRNDLDKVPVSTFQASSFANDFQLYPNPVQGEVTLDLPTTFTGEVSLISVEGRLLATRQVMSGPVTLSTERLAPGPFLVIARDQRTGMVYRQKALKR